MAQSHVVLRAVLRSRASSSSSSIFGRRRRFEDEDEGRGRAREHLAEEWFVGRGTKQTPTIVPIEIRGSCVYSRGETEQNRPSELTGFSRSPPAFDLQEFTRL